MKLRKRIANLLGYDLIKSKYLATQESGLVEVLRQLRIGTVLDVGANVGQYGRLLRDIGYRGNICSFEPIPEYYEQLKAEAAGDARWFVYPYALGEREEELDINVSSKSVFSSFLPVNEYGTQNFQRSSEVVRQERVRISTLDAFFEREPRAIEGAVFLKMDTQGYDLNVIKGGQGVISGIAGLQSELSIRPIYDGMPRYLEALATYEGLGFQLVGIYPVSRDKQDRALIELDCLMLRPAGSDK